jgi:microfibrillar-associated protein 1
MPPKFTPRAPQIGRYWPGKPLKDEEESSSDDDDEEEEEDQRQQDRPQVEEPPKTDVKNASAAKLVTTMKTATLSEQGPYAGFEEESSESESGSEEEEPSLPEKRTSRIRQAHRRAIGDFVAVDRVDLEEEEEEEVRCIHFDVTNIQSSGESSEEESSEEDVVLPKRPLMRPTFIPKYVLSVSII